MYLIEYLFMNEWFIYVLYNIDKLIINKIFNLMYVMVDMNGE